MITGISHVRIVFFFFLIDFIIVILVLGSQQN